MGNKTPQQKGIEKGNKNNGIEGYQEVQTWLRTVSEKSRRLYLSALRKFCEFSGKKPDELIRQRDEELKNSDHNNRTGIRDLVLDFRVYLEKEEYAGKTINALDGAVRGFFTAVLGKGAMINVKNYRNAQVRQKKDLVPTLEELRKILDVCSIEEKFRIIFLAQTGMRISDALAMKVGDIQREMDLGNIPLAISYLPEKDREAIGERITFLASDGVEILKAYLRWRRDLGEEITGESPLFVSRTSRGENAIHSEKMNEMIHRIAKKAGLNGTWPFGILRAHSFRKFFITQMTNHGVQDKVVDFFVGHAVTEIDRVYWSRRTEDLRKIYADRQQHLNPISLKQEYDLSKIEGLQAKISELEKQMASILTQSVQKEEFESRIVSSESEVIELSNKGWKCQTIGPQKWLMKRNLRTSGNHCSVGLQ